MSREKWVAFFAAIKSVFHLPVFENGRNNSAIMRIITLFQFFLLVTGNMLKFFFQLLIFAKLLTEVVSDYNNLIIYFIMLHQAVR